MHYLLDGDPGHDDMLTIFLAAKHLDVVGITTVSGNQSLEKTTLNARKCVELAGLTDIPIAKGLPRPLLNEPRYAPEIHGQTGLDGVALPEPTVALSPLHAVDFIIEASHRYDDLWLVPTGPLTNIAAALIKDPTLAERIKGISLMGGSMTYGGSTAAAEFNIYVDPEAADVVFRSGVPLKMFGLNVTRMASATVARLDRIRAIGTPFARTVADLVEFYRASLHKVYGLEGASIHDPLAVAIFIKPELFTMQAMNVQIELNGTHTRGMTVCDYRYVGNEGKGIYGEEGIIRGAEPNCEVAVDMDVDGFFDLLTDTLALYR
ncbi:nucleoside hydrolase [Micropruina sp.]|uniref:nucleoside hydrolase n=1 Tax=Micropruina sp. TaxID=2737536 RepID=UPI00261FC179|nr:nucleoside hydrolase [Micropruina sp.]